MALADYFFAHRPQRNDTPGFSAGLAPPSIVVPEAAEARAALPRMAAGTLLVAGAITVLAAAVIRKRRAYVEEEP